MEKKLNQDIENIMRNMKARIDQERNNIIKFRKVFRDMHQKIMLLEHGDNMHGKDIQDLMWDLDRVIEECYVYFGRLPDWYRESFDIHMQRMATAYMKLKIKYV